MTLKEKLANGQKIVGTMLRITRNPAVSYLAKNAGLDFVMYDCEHSNYNFETLHDAFVTANALSFSGLVRVPEGTKDNISRVLDSGAIGVMVPMVETKEHAETVVKYSKYQPIGDRGYTAGGAHTAYLNGKHVDLMKQGNDKVLSIAQIETKLAVENAEAIAATEGIDVLLIGPNDLSLSLGIPGDMMNPIELDAIAKVAAACKKHKKYFGMHAGAALIEKFGSDLNVVMSLTDTDFLLQGFAGIRKLADSL
ncbi:hpch/hpai aldolase [Synergistales bacterium]|nr:hpch/hpai aldolase [Synergistales bacterium]